MKLLTTPRHIEKMARIISPASAVLGLSLLLQQGATMGGMIEWIGFAALFGAGALDVVASSLSHRQALQSLSAAVASPPAAQ